MYAADGISDSVTSNCSVVIAERARLLKTVCIIVVLSAHRVCVLWNSSITKSSVYIAYSRPTVLLEYTNLQLGCIECYCYLHACE